LIVRQAVPYKVIQLQHFFRYSSLVGTISKKFAKKRHKSDGQINTSKDTDTSSAKRMKKKHKKQFMKPSDDWHKN